MCAVQVPLDSTQAGLQFAAGKLVLAVAAQVYTERMGHIKLSCEGGCTCDAVEYNLLHPFYRCRACHVCVSKPDLDELMWTAQAAC